MNSLWPDSVDIREVGPRDGLQIEAPISTEAKTRLLDALAATGVGRIEATAFVSPRAVPAMADAEQVAATSARSLGPSGPRSWPARTGPAAPPPPACG